MSNITSFGDGITIEWIGQSDESSPVDEFEGSLVDAFDGSPVDDFGDPQTDLRRAIMEIQNDAGLSSPDKARKMQELMSSQWKPVETSEFINKLSDKRSNFETVTDADKTETFYDRSKGILGCSHYQRCVKIQAPCCGRWDACRFCHDEVSDHKVARNLVDTMMCMFCKCVQPAAQDCVSCGKRLGAYYCAKCKIWDNHKRIYHCDDCGICRLGRGIGLDYFHCERCNACMSLSLKDRHKCIERSLESDCPICGEFLFSSTLCIVFMPCGHPIHDACKTQHMAKSYQCPICLKSLTDMREHFEEIDRVLASQTMPPQYGGLVNHIYCNDCESKSYAKWHFVYHKCGDCAGYNTSVLETVKEIPSDVQVSVPTLGIYCHVCQGHTTTDRCVGSSYQCDRCNLGFTELLR